MKASVYKIDYENSQRIGFTAHILAQSVDEAVSAVTKRGAIHVSSVEPLVVGIHLITESIIDFLAQPLLKNLEERLKNPNVKRLPSEATQLAPAKEYVCEVCGYKGKSKAGLVTHLRMKHGIQKEK